MYFLYLAQVLQLYQEEAVSNFIVKMVLWQLLCSLIQAWIVKMFTNRYVHKQIRKRFCKYKDSQFEFLKALDDDLVKPGVEKVDYKTMKHIIGQGSAYLSLDRNFSLIMNMILMKMILNRKVAVSIAP